MTNLRSTSSVDNITSGQKVIDMADKVWDWEPDTAPFLKLLTLSSAGKRAVESTVFYHLEQQRLAVTTTTTASHTNSVTTLKLTATDFLQPDDVIKNTSTDENMLVATIVSSNSITVTRAWGEVSGTAMSSGDTILNLGPAYADGAAAQTPLQRLLDTGSNYIQDFRKESGLDWNTDATKMYSGSERERLRKDAMRELKRKMEMAFLYGQLKAGGTANAPKRQMRGLKYFISTNVHNIGGALTEATFLGHLEGDFTYGSSRKVLLASARFITAMASWGLNRLRGNEAMTKALGIQVDSYTCPFGQMDVAWHKLIDRAGYTGSAFLIDPDNVRYTYQKGRDFQMRPDIQAPNEHKYIDEFYAYASLDMLVEKSHAYYYGVTG